SSPGEDRVPEALIVSAHHEIATPAVEAALVCEAVDAARDLQNAPGHALTPPALAEHARTLDGVSVEILDRGEIEAAGMGAFAGVARGSDEEPRLIVGRSEPGALPRRLR